MDGQLVCPTCKTKLSNGASINGKPQFFCINPECVDRFKTIGVSNDGKETSSTS